MSDAVIGVIYIIVMAAMRNQSVNAYGALIGFLGIFASLLMTVVLLPSIRDPWVWYAVCWLVSYGMYIGFSWIGLRYASIVTSVLVAFEAFMVLDGYFAGDKITAAYVSYPYVITGIHALIIITLFFERGGDGAINDRGHPHRRRGDKSDHRRVAGGK